MKIKNAKSKNLFIEKFEVQSVQAWGIIGSNRSGIRDFFDLICGKLCDVTADHLTLPDNLGWVCFKDQQKIYERELKNDDTDYMDRLDPGTLVKDFLDNVQDHLALIEKFGMTSCLDKGYRQLSTGQARKTLILSQIIKGRSALAIQAPFEGLDPAGRKEVSEALYYLHCQKVLLLLFVHNMEDIPSWCTHAALMKSGELQVQGIQKQVLAQIEKQMQAVQPDFQVSVQDYCSDKECSDKEKKGQEDMAKCKTNRVQLVCLRSGSAGYGGNLVFKDLSLNIFQGDHTLITGPNGCGKSTLLHMITGDHPACYRNDLKIFNIQRGTGESIWELKKKMGIVSPELHRNYYIPGSTINCIISGLFDSIGLYQPYSRQQEKQARRWLDHLGMADKTNMAFRDLTYADQRLVLIARALIKQPELLILDEPTQGLDAANRKALLDFLEQMTQQTCCTILYVSHREDEYRSFFVDHIQMGNQE
ncbi:MAG: ATP-binding cassette domain-containing protein [Pseudomonadota bacterium]